MLTSSLMTGVCELELNNNAYSPGQDFVAGRIQFELTQDLRMNQNNNYVMEYAPYQGLQDCLDLPSIWANYTLPSQVIQVRSPVTQPLTCSSWGDPHITTVHGYKGDNYLLGDFTLASVVDEAKQIYMQIQVRHFKCGRVSCNCAVIVREGNSVLGLDMCPDAVGNWVNLDMGAVSAVRYLGLAGEGGVLPDGASIHRDGAGRRFFIVMASGLTVDVHLYSYLNLHVTFPPKYAAASIGGMCGSRSIGTGEQFRLTATQSLFVTRPQCVPWPTQRALQCACDRRGTDTIASCGARDGVTVSNSVEVTPAHTGLVCPLTPPTPTPTTTSTRRPEQRRRRDLTVVIAWGAPELTLDRSDNRMELSEAFSDPLYDPTHGRGVRPGWPTQGGLTEGEVERRCRDALRSSSVYLQCVGRVNVTNLLDDCKLDTQIMDSYDFLQSYRDTFESQCINVVMWEANVTTLAELEGNALYRGVADHTCGWQCSARGRCVNGTCACNEGFVGAACETERGRAPRLVEISRGGQCNLAGRDCTKVLLIASNVYDSPSLACRFTPHTLMPGLEGEGSNETLQTPAMMLNRAVLQCSLPPGAVQGSLRGYRLAVSHDGRSFSNELDWTVTDLTCLEPRPEGGWAQRAGTCLLRGRCYATGHRLDCLVCSPADQDINVWINECERGVGWTVLYALLALLCAAALCTMLVWRCFRPACCVRSSSSSVHMELIK